MSKELLEIKCAKCATSHFVIVEPISQGEKPPRVKLYSEDEVLQREYDNWGRMEDDFVQRGWTVTDIAIWDDNDTFAGQVRMLNELAAAGCTKDTDWSNLLGASTNP